MKWSEFKRLVDETIKESGVDDPDIDYIDIGALEWSGDEIVIGVDERTKELCIGS